MYQNQPSQHSSFVDNELEDPFEECHYQRLSYEGRSNIFSLAIPDHNFGETKFDRPLPRLSILAALTDGVYVLRENKDKWTTITEPVDQGDEFTSLDAYYPENFRDGSFLICYAKTNVNSNTYSINFAKLSICSQSLDRPDESFIKVVDRYNLPVPWAPLKITHTNPVDTTNKNPAFIVCSSTHNVSVFTQMEKNKFEFKEVAMSEIYPELTFLQELESNIIALSINTENNIRYVAAGCNDGTLICVGTKYLSGKHERFIFSKIKLHYPISSLILFEQSEFKEGTTGKALLATCAINTAVVFNDLELNSPVYLPIPYEGDTVLCAALADVDLDGRQEIILGTYNQQLLIYKSAFKSFALVSQRKLPYPIFGIIDCDFDADGLKELVVLTMYGIHVLKPKLALARERILTYLNYLSNTIGIEESPDLASG